jgi:hypothetical protein
LTEELLGVIKNVQAKGKTSMIKKTCDLYITDKRVVCIVLGSSVFVSAMVGQAVMGVSGAFALGGDAQRGADSKRLKSVGKDMDEMIEKNPDSYSLEYDKFEKATFNTSFFATLGMFAQLIVKYADGKTYYYDTPNSTKDVSKQILSRVDKIDVK